MRRTVNSQYGYTHKITGETAKKIKKLKIFNVFDPKCNLCVRMGEQQSCRESCAAYKRNPQNHIASHNCKIGKCAAKLASACKKCIRTCHNIMSVALDQTDKGTPDLKKTTFETCYHTFGCANDCDASLKKVKGALTAKDSRETLTFVGDLELKDQVKWAQNFPFESMKEARDKGFFNKGELDLTQKNAARNQERPLTEKEFKNKGWWWKA